MRQYKFALALSFLLLFGSALRIYPSGTFPRRGYDEQLYRAYVTRLGVTGLSAYPDLVERYIQEQSASPKTYLPPTRLLYIVCGYVWMETFRCEPLSALHAVSTLFSILTMGLCAIWSYRLRGRTVCLTTVALMACAPIEIHMAQHAMIDGFFAFWGLLAAWGLWESLRAPEKIGWQFLFAAAIACMVLTKENAFFIYIALLALVGVNYILRFGTVTRQTLLMMVAGPLAGTVILLFAAGGVENTIHVYQLLVAKAYTLTYAIENCDGPWHRYLMDLLIMSPLVFLPAVAAALRIRFADKASLYLLGFVAASYVIMCNVKYSMNLRYATIWDFPLRYLAIGQLLLWSRAAGKHGQLLFIGLVSVICLHELHQYYFFFVEKGLYELVSSGLLYALKIIK